VHTLVLERARGVRRDAAGIYFSARGEKWRVGKWGLATPFLLTARRVV